MYIIVNHILLLYKHVYGCTYSLCLPFVLVPPLLQVIRDLGLRQLEGPDDVAGIAHLVWRDERERRPLVSCTTGTPAAMENER